MEPEDKKASETDNNPGGDTQTNTTPTIEAVTAELETVRKALKQANAESAQRRKRLEELEAEENKRKDAEKTELQKALDKAAELEAQLAKQTETVKQTTIQHAVEITAAKLGFTDPGDALSLLDHSAIKIGDNGKVDGVEDALKDLLKRKPYLAKTGAQQPETDSQKRPSGSSKTADDILAEKRAQYSGF